MVRTILGSVTGIILAVLALYGAQYGYAHFHPAPRGAVPATPEAVAAFVSKSNPTELVDYATSAPVQAIACLLAGWALSAFLGGWLGAAIAKPHRGSAATVVGALVTVAVVVYATWMPAQAWITVVGLLLPMLFALLGGRLAMPRREF
ncbi:hypothetical protein [Luteimonas aquatica]|uniref:hypothetical protein n=1 Tax=Luteimonas aquatica TaxID=450364 RepID=UPI001F5A9C1A|nr:hypothetical protein [Luteimonas aquatica]